jgi:hypothetical protein
MYPLPEQSEPQPARLRPLSDMKSAAPAPLSAPLAGDLFQPRSRAEDTEPEPPRVPSAPPGWAPDQDRQRDQIRDEMGGLSDRALAASSWLQSSRHYSQLLNRDGVVPVTARMTVSDLTFLAEAREQILRFSELTVRLIDLHQPLDAGGISTDPACPVRRCRSCMWRWPCPTFSILAEVVGHPPAT